MFLVFLILLALSLFSEVPIVQGLVWSTGTKLTPSLTIETKPYVIEDKQGFLWAVWESYRSANWDIYGRRFDGSSWLSEEKLTSSTSTDLNPALAQLNNGTILLVWASDRSGGFSLFSKRFNSGSWSGEVSLTSSPGRDSTPSLLQSSNGTLWFFWTRETVSGQTVVRDVYYKTYTSGVWSSDVPFAISTASEFQPSVAQADDGTIWVEYASSRAGNLDIYYRTFKTTWSSETPLTFSGDDDRQPWIIQDLNGTLWSFWSRCVTTSEQLCQDDVFYKTSTNLGVSWSSDVLFTIDPVGVEVFDSEPAAFHARDKRIYLFWSTTLTGDGGDLDVYYSTSDPIPIHDLGLANALAFPTSVAAKDIVKANVTVKNLGDYTEAFRVDGYYENTTRTFFASASGTLPAGLSTRIQLSWNTTGVPSAVYKIIILLAPVAGESVRRLSDNSADAGSVTVLPRIIPADIDMDGDVDIIDAARLAVRYGAMMGPEDINRDCVVDILDAAILAAAYGSRSGDPKWNPGADLDKNGRVDIIDAAILASKYGTKMGREDINRDCVVDILDAATLAVSYGFKG